MTVTDAFWFTDNGLDIHVVRGAKPSRRLDQDLVLKLDNGNFVLGHEPPPGVTVRFEARFKGAPDNQDVRLDTATGEVTAKKPAPPGRPLRNFMVRGVVQDPTAPNAFEVQIRVHIHRAVQRIRLTPPILSVRMGVPEQERVHFGLLAEFDDGITGEVFHWPGLLWRSAAPDAISVSQLGLEAKRVNEDVDITVSLDPAVYPAPLPPPAKARAQSLQSWADLAKSLDLKYVSAGKSKGPGPKRFDEATNVLFLPEGFTDAEQDEFDDIVVTIVKQLRTMGTVRPLSVDLKGTINFWRAFVPSRHPPPGLSLLSECYTYSPQGDDSRGAELDRLEPSKPAPTDTWTLPNLVHEVGLPVPTDDTLIRQDDNPAHDKPGTPLVSKVGHWKELYGKDSNNNEFIASRIPEVVYMNWIRLASRALVNERDTAFHLALGGRPRAERQHVLGLREPRSLQFHPRRMNADRFRQDVLSNLRVGKAGAGAAWATGKDQGLVCFVARIRRARAEFNPGDGHFFIPVDEMDFHPLRSTASGVELVAGDLPVLAGKRLEYALSSVHELGHALGLGDEYGERGLLPADQEDKVEQDIASAQNLQLQRSLRAGAGPALDPAKLRRELRWLWPRVRAGGVLARKPQPEGTLLVTGNVLTIPLRKGHARSFKKDDVVFLRRRPLPEQTALVPWLRVEGPPSGDQLRARVIVGIADPDPVSSAIFVGQSDKSDDQQASVVLAAVLSTAAPVDPATGMPNFLPLVAPRLVQHMATTRGPLDSPAAKPTQGCDPKRQENRRARSPFTIPSNLPAKLLEQLPEPVRKRLRARKYFIIGLYHGGHRYFCGVFHPGGVCLMNEQRRHRRGKHRFCHVCRYLLVDRIDPTRHGAIDAAYAGEYPEPSP